VLTAVQDDVFSEQKTTPSARERRVDLRLSPEKLSAPASIRIPNRPAVTLVDLSPGGALLDLPFQIRPDSRMTVEFRAASERMMLPFRLLRCYVTSLRGGVRYQAAGAFEDRLEWEPLLVDAAAEATSNRLIATLETFLRQGPAAGRVVELDRLLMWILDAVRRGEPAERIAVEIRQRLTGLIPSVKIEPASTASLPDPARGARFFGFDFRCERMLTALDRRILRVAAQLLSIVKASGHRAARPNPSPSPPLDFVKHRHDLSPVIAYSVADWQEMCSTSVLELDPWPLRRA
jgi:hypothetical protein